ncbi:MAG TPA: DUF1579 family protein [Longimicrobium sp.]|jgi:hypothetical protein
MPSPAPRAVLVALALFAAPAAARAQETPTDPARQAEMAAMLEAARPGPEHARLAALEGTWDVALRILGGPGFPPMQAAGTANSRMVLGGRFLLVESKTSEGPEMESLTILGFDRRAKEYTLVGYDTGGTFYVTGAGRWDEAARTITYSGESRDPSTGHVEAYDLVMRQEGPDRYTKEMVMRMPDGGRFKVFEAVYTRRR